MSKKNRFVVPDVVRLPLFGGSLNDPDCEWVEVKAKLTYGDHQRISGAILDSLVIPPEMLAEGSTKYDKFADDLRVKLDSALDGIYKILIWLIDWNLEGPDGKVPKVTEAAVLSLDVQTAKEILRVIDEHENAVVTEGKETTGAPN